MKSRDRKTLFKEHIHHVRIPLRGHLLPTFRGEIDRKGHFCYSVARCKGDGEIIERKQGVCESSTSLMSLGFPIKNSTTLLLEAAECEFHMSIQHNRKIHNFYSILY